jgi:hypothetical protein
MGNQQRRGRMRVSDECVGVGVVTGGTYLQIPDIAVVGRKIDDRHLL